MVPLQFHTFPMYGPKHPDARLITADDLVEIKRLCETPINQFAPIRKWAALFGYKDCIGIQVCDGDILRLKFHWDELSGDYSGQEFCVDIPVQSEDESIASSELPQELNYVG